MPDLEALRLRFEDAFGSTPSLFRAPGRVNLIGEHTDYNSGLVMPAALQFNTTVAIARHRRPRLRVCSAAFDQTVEIPLADRRVLQESRARGHWSDYVIGVVLALWEQGVPVPGADLLIHSDIPLGSGLSSSASFEVGVALALSEMAEHPLPKRALATLCQQAENAYVGTRCGIMDQFASVFGLADHAIALDCRTLAYQEVPLLGRRSGLSHPAVSLVICNTMVRHAHAGGEYNRRRAECETAVAHLARAMPGLTTLRDVSLAELDSHGRDLDPVIRRRARHIVSENLRVSRAIEALEAADSPAFGQLMLDSHRSLRDDYEVSCEELDLMVGLAGEVEGVYGARMTGGGFGGCTVNWVRSEAVDEFIPWIRKHYAGTTGVGPEIYPCAAADGAARID